MPPDFDPFNVEVLRRMLSANDYGAVEQPKPFMTREECEQRSREISEADVIFAHGLGVKL
jgi:hypothetical protein